MTDSPNNTKNTLSSSHLNPCNNDNNDNSPSFSWHAGETHLTQGRRHLSRNIHESLHDAYADLLMFI